MENLFVVVLDIKEWNVNEHFNNNNNRYQIIGMIPNILIENIILLLYIAESWLQYNVYVTILQIHITLKMF